MKFGNIQINGDFPLFMKLVYDHCLIDEKFGRQFVDALVAIPINSTERHEIAIHREFLFNLENNFAICEQLQLYDKEGFRNAVKLLGYFNFKLQVLYRDLIHPFIQVSLKTYLNMLLEAKEDEDIAVFAAQFYMNGNFLRKTQSEIWLVNKAINVILIEDSLQKSSLIWMRLVIDVSFNSYFILPPKLQQFYARCLDEKSAMELNRIHETLLKNDVRTKNSNSLPNTDEPPKIICFDDDSISKYLLDTFQCEPEFNFQQTLDAWPLTVSPSNSDEEYFPASLSGEFIDTEPEIRGPRPILGRQQHNLVIGNPNSPSIKGTWNQLSLYENINGHKLPPLKFDDLPKSIFPDSWHKQISNPEERHQADGLFQQLKNFATAGNPSLTGDDTYATACSRNTGPGMVFDNSCAPIKQMNDAQTQTVSQQKRYTPPRFVRGKPTKIQPENVNNPTAPAKNLGAIPKTTKPPPKKNFGAIPKTTRQPSKYNGRSTNHGMAIFYNVPEFPNIWRQEYTNGGDINRRSWYNEGPMQPTDRFGEIKKTGEPQ